MNNLNETIEQNLEQTKGQRNLNILITRPIYKVGQKNDLLASFTDAERHAQKLMDMFSNNEVSWGDKLKIKLRELDDALRQASDDSINRQV